VIVTVVNCRELSVQPGRASRNFLIDTLLGTDVQLPIFEAELAFFVKDPKPFTQTRSHVKRSGLPSSG
jgi:hypothetical protein